MSNIERSIAYYKKDGDEFVGEYEINIDLDIIRSMWSAYEDDPLYYMIYPVQEAQKATVEKLLGKDLEFEKYDYFLECHSV